MKLFRTSFLSLALLSAVFVLAQTSTDEAEPGAGGMTGGAMTGGAMTGGSMSGVADNDAVSIELPSNLTELTIAEVISSSSDFSLLDQFVRTANLEETLSGEGPFTVFAPVDAAFVDLSDEQVSALLENPEMLAELLSYHVVEGEYLASDLQTGATLTTVQGETLTIGNTTVVIGDMTGGAVTGGAMTGGTAVGGEVPTTGITVNEANILEADVLTANGVIHVIDGVLAPSGVELGGMTGGTMTGGGN